MKIKLYDIKISELINTFEEFKKKYGNCDVSFVCKDCKKGTTTVKIKRDKLNHEIIVKI